MPPGWGQCRPEYTRRGVSLLDTMLCCHRRSGWKSGNHRQPTGQNMRLGGVYQVIPLCRNDDAFGLRLSYLRSPENATQLVQEWRIQDEKPSKFRITDKQSLANGSCRPSLRRVRKAANTESI